MAWDERGLLCVCTVYLHNYEQTGRDRTTIPCPADLGLQWYLITVFISQMLFMNCLNRLPGTWNCVHVTGTLT